MYRITSYNVCYTKLLRVVTATITPDSGYAFCGWTAGLAGTSLSASLTVGSADVSLSASILV